MLKCGSVYEQARAGSGVLSFICMHQTVPIGLVLFIFWALRDLMKSTISVSPIQRQTLRRRVSVFPV